MVVLPSVVPVPVPPEAAVAVPAAAAPGPIQECPTRANRVEEEVSLRQELAEYHENHLPDALLDWQRSQLDVPIAHGARANRCRDFFH